MAKKASQKRIFAREQVEVDPRSGGIRGASRAPQALGDIHGSSNVGRSYVNPAWGSVSDTLSALIAGVQANAKEESELDKKLQIMMGKAAAVEADSAVREGVIKGEITDLGQVRQKLMEEHGMTNPSMNPYFRLGFEEVGLETMKRESALKNEGIKAETVDSGMHTASYSLREAFQGVRNGIVGFEDFEERLRLSHEVAQGYGVPLPQIRKATFDLAQAEVEIAILSGDINKAVDLIDFYSKSSLTGYALPGQPGSREALIKSSLELINQYKDREFIEENRLQQQLTQDRQNRLTEHRAQLEKMDLVQLQEAKEALKATSTDDLIDRFGSAASTILSDLEKQKMYVQHGRVPDGNQEALVEIKGLIQAMDPDILYDESYVEARWGDMLLGHQKEEIRQLIKAAQEQKDPTIESSVMHAISGLNDYFMPKRDNKGRIIPADAPYGNLTLVEADPINPAKTKFSAAGALVESRMWEELRKINPSEQRYKDNPDLLFRDQMAAVKKVEAELRNGKADWLFPRVNLGLATGQEPVTTNPRFFTEEDMANPEKKAVFDAFVNNPSIEPEVRKRNARSVVDPKLREGALELADRDVAAKVTKEARDYFIGKTLRGSPLDAPYAEARLEEAAATAGASLTPDLVRLEGMIDREQAEASALRDRLNNTARGKADGPYRQELLRRLAQHEQLIHDIAEEHRKITLGGVELVQIDEAIAREQNALYAAEQRQENTTARLANLHKLEEQRRAKKHQANVDSLVKRRQELIGE